MGELRWGGGSKIQKICQCRLWMVPSIEACYCRCIAELKSMFAYRVYKYYCTCIYIDRTVENEVKAGNKQIKVRLFFRQHLKTETTKMHLTYVS